MMRVIERRNVLPGKAFQWMGAGLVAASGVLSQLLESLRAADSITHVLFGLALSLGVIFRFHYGLWVQNARADAAAIIFFARRVTRMLYLFLYGLFVVKVLLNWTPGNFTEPEKFWPYLIAGLVALVLTRALTIISIAGHARR